MLELKPHMFACSCWRFHSNCACAMPLLCLQGRSKGIQALTSRCRLRAPGAVLDSNCRSLRSASGRMMSARSADVSLGGHCALSRSNVTSVTGFRVPSLVCTRTCA